MKNCFIQKLYGFKRREIFCVCWEVSKFPSPSLFFLNWPMFVVSLAIFRPWNLFWNSQYLYNIVLQLFDNKKRYEGCSHFDKGFVTTYEMGMEFRC